YEAGRIRFEQVQRSQQAVLRAESQLVTAQDSYRTRLDDFKLRIGMSIDQPLEIVPVALAVEAPEPDMTAAVELASRYRLDLQTARDRIEDAQRLVQVAENGLLPDLDLQGDIGVENRPGSP